MTARSKIAGDEFRADVQYILARKGKKKEEKSQKRDGFGDVVLKAMEDAAESKAFEENMLVEHEIPVFERKESVEIPEATLSSDWERLFYDRNVSHEKQRRHPADEDPNEFWYANKFTLK